MQPTRILPDLECSLLCEEVRQEINGNFIILGVLGYIRVPQVPITAFRICAFNRWVAGIGSFQESVRLIAPDQSTLVRESKMKFTLAEPSHHATNVTFFTQVEFTMPGVYHVEVLVDDVMKLRYPLPVLVVPQPAQGQQPQPPQAPAVS